MTDISTRCSMAFYDLANLTRFLGDVEKDIKKLETALKKAEDEANSLKKDLDRETELFLRWRQKAEETAAELEAFKNGTVAIQSFESIVRGETAAQDKLIEMGWTPPPQRTEWPFPNWYR